MSSRYDFLIDTYDTERLKTLSVWSMFADGDLQVRPHPTDTRGRNAHEQMVHQCVSEDLWFCKMLDMDVGAPPLPEEENRLAFIERYAEDSGRRLAALKEKEDGWWEREVEFFEVRRSRAWIATRRIAHSAHHRGQLTAQLRVLGCDLHSTSGPTADTGGLMQNNAPTVYPYEDIEALLAAEMTGGARAPLPGPGDVPATERPD